MPNLEKKLLCFVQKHIAVLGIVCLLLVSAALRYFLLPYHSIDYVAALEVWYENFRSFGGWRALARDVGNYNMLYRTLMAAISYLPNPLVSIKLVSILLDYIGAAAAALLAHEVCRQAGRTAAAARRSAAAAGIVVLFLPSVVMNGAMWAQCDMMYVTFLLLCALFFYKEKYMASFLWLGVAFSLKLQAVFLCPALLILYVVKKKFSVLNFLWMPAMLEFFAIPSIVVTLILHGDVGEALWRPFNIYLGQGAEAHIASTYPNAATWLSGAASTFDWNGTTYRFIEGNIIPFFRAGMMLFCFGVLGMAAVWLISRQAQFGARTTLLLFIFSFYTCLIFLPGMHERYGLAVLVLLVVYTAATGRLAPLTACMAAMDTMIYIPFLFQGSMPLEIQTLSVLNIVLYGAFCFAFLRELRAEAFLPAQN